MGTNVYVDEVSSAHGRMGEVGRSDGRLKALQGNMACQVRMHPVPCKGRSIPHSLTHEQTRRQCQSHRKRT